MWIGNMSKKKKTNNNRTNNPYFVDKLASIPPHVKIGFLKFWLAGASFFLTFNGLPYAFDFLDRAVMLFLVLILGIEYISNMIIIWMHTDQIDTKKYLPHEVDRKSFLSFIATAGYLAIMILAIHFTLELWVSIGLPTIGDIMSEQTADPFSFALLFLLYDYIWYTTRGFIKNRTKKV
jgi:hypothetical protein